MEQRTPFIAAVGFKSTKEVLQKLAYVISIPNKWTMEHSNLKYSNGNLYCTVSIIPPLLKFETRLCWHFKNVLYCTVLSESYIRLTEDYKCI